VLFKFIRNALYKYNIPVPPLQDFSASRTVCFSFLERTAWGTFPSVTSVARVLLYHWWNVVLCSQPSPVSRPCHGAVGSAELTCFICRHNKLRRRLHRNLTQSLLYMHKDYMAYCCSDALYSLCYDFRSVAYSSVPFCNCFFFIDQHDVFGSLRVIR